LLIFVVKNTFFKEKNCLDDYPEIIKKYNLEGKYDTAKWVLYAMNANSEYQNFINYDIETQRALENKPFLNEMELRQLIGDEKVAKIIECELKLMQDDSARIFQENAISLSLFPHANNQQFWRYGKGQAHTIKFNADTILSVGLGHGINFSYPQFYIQSECDEFGFYLNENYDIAHCWLKQYYENNSNATPPLPIIVVIFLLYQRRFFHSCIQSVPSAYNKYRRNWSNIFLQYICHVDILRYRN